jgi:hypothetical protein
MRAEGKQDVLAAFHDSVRRLDRSAEEWQAAWRALR